MNTENNNTASNNISQSDLNNQPLYGAAPVPHASQVQPPPTLEDNLKKLQDKWTDEIASLNEKMKTLKALDELLGVIYTKRQEAVDYYHGINTVILKQSREYKVSFNMMCNAIRVNGVNGMRLQEAQIQKHVESELIDKKAAIEQLSNHNAYIKETIQTIDNMIYGINQKIKLAEILNGLKF